MSSSSSLKTFLQDHVVPMADRLLLATEHVSNTHMVVACASVFLMSSLFWSHLQHRRDEQRQRRRFSFTSQSMQLGVFPPKMNAPETIINACILFTGETKDTSLPTIEALASKMVQPMLNYHERLRSVPNVEEQGGGLKVLDPQPQDLIRVVVSSESTPTAIYKTIFSQCTKNLSQRTTLPWWEVLRVECNDSSAGAVVLRLHHGLADGLSLIQLFEASGILTDMNGGKPVSSLSQFMQKQQQQPTEDKKGGFDLALAWWTVAKSYLEVLTLGASPYDDSFIWNQAHLTPKHSLPSSKPPSMTLLPTVPLGLVSELKKTASSLLKKHITVNDVLLTAVCQAIFEYGLKHNDQKLLQVAQAAESGASFQCRALLPVACPRPWSELSNPATSLRNSFAMVSCAVDMVSLTILKRLQGVNQHTQQIKSNPYAILQLWNQNSLLPQFGRPLATMIGQQTASDIFTRHSFVFSNTPGPPQPCRLAGQLATGGVQMFFPNVIPQISFVSYAGNMYGNVIWNDASLPGNVATELPALFAKAMITLSQELQDANDAIFASKPIITTSYQIPKELETLAASL